MWLIIVALSSFTLQASGQKSESTGDASALLLQDFSLNNTIFDFSMIKTSLLYLPRKQSQESVLKLNQAHLSFDKTPTAFFCRIEDAIAKSSKINMKFRLGSVQYVDALEGKGYFEALSYSKATNFHMSRQKKD